MGETIAAALRVSAASGLLFLPGSWIAFGRPAAGHPFLARLALAVVLSPLVVVLEFYAFRAIGVSFVTTAVALAVMNVPAVLLIVRPLCATRWTGWTAVGVWLSFLALPAMYLTTWLADTQVRANWGHAWTHADIVYQLSNGRLHPEEPLLAGARLAYPWLAHVYQGVLSCLADRPPSVAYLPINVAWLAAVIVFVAALVAKLGGGLLAQASSLAWLCFGVDWLGAVGARMLPPSVIGRNLVFGDERFTPWLRKFGIFEPTALGIASFAALLYVLSCHDEENRGGAPWLLVLTTLLTGGIFYPLLFPAGLAAVGGRMLVLVARRGPRTVASRRRELMGLALAAGASAVATVGYLRVVVMDRAPGAVLGVSDASMIEVKAAALLVALAPALVAIIVDGRSDWRAAPRTTGLLLFGATASMAIYVAADIPHIANEYKFVFTAAVCLAPFPAIALARSLARLGRGAYPLALAAALILAWPAIAGFRRGGIVGRPGPQLDLAQFAVRLANEEPLSGALDAIRSATPVNAVVVSRETAFDITTITQRATYVPFSPDMLHGVGLPADYLLKDVRGYPAALVDMRREKVQELFGATGTPARPAAALEIRNELQRPVVLIVRGEDDPALMHWLSTAAQARRVYQDSLRAVWMLDPVAGSLWQGSAAHAQSSKLPNQARYDGAAREVAHAPTTDDRSGCISVDDLGGWWFGLGRVSRRGSLRADPHGDEPEPVFRGWLSDRDCVYRLDQLRDATPTGLHLQLPLGAERRREDRSADDPAGDQSGIHGDPRELAPRSAGQPVQRVGNPLREFRQHASFPKLAGRQRYVQVSARAFSPG